ncbi:hypothetical protein CC2G_013794 [Coprinopsis cinerea AmutBmut pab1-1]|nr:hypothetical protein CC2G_013794 [Coprinopsis cinerea AmutBmut pab1-1]
MFRDEGEERGFEFVAASIKFNRRSRAVSRLRFPQTLPLLDAGISASWLTRFSLVLTCITFASKATRTSFTIFSRGRVFLSWRPSHTRELSQTQNHRLLAPWSGIAFQLAILEAFPARFDPREGMIMLF